MNTKLSMLLLFTVVITLKGLGQDYIFSQSTGTFTPLSGATSLNGTTPWDDDEWTENIGFNFKYFDKTYTTVTITDGYVYFDNFADHYIVVFGTDLIDRDTMLSKSPINVKLEGTAGSRVLKIEWLNAGLYDGVPADFTNFQLWLHEGSNQITMIYGNTQIADINDAFYGETGPYVGVGNLKDNDNPFYHLEGSPASATMKTDLGTTLDGIPANGTIYKFSKTGGPIGIANNDKKQSLKIYPNPCSNVIYVTASSIDATPSQVSIIDITGKTVLDLNVVSTDRSIIELDIKALKQGMYFLQTHSKEGVQTERIIKR